MWHCLTVERGITHGGLGNSAETDHQGENIEQKCTGTLGPYFKENVFHCPLANVSIHPLPS